MVSRYERDRVEKYAECGSLGHAWFDVDSDTWNPKWGTPVTFRCERCGGERRESWDRIGEMSNRHYKMPEDYKWAKGQRPNRAEFRAALLRKRRRKPETANVILIESAKRRAR